MVQLSTPWGDPLPGNGRRRFLSNYFDLLFIVLSWGPIFEASEDLPTKFLRYLLCLENRATGHETLLICTEGSVYV